MADINQQAIIEIEINGQKAKRELNSLTSYAEALRDQITQANKAGDSKWAKQLQKELNKTNNQIRAMQRNTVNINETLKNLSLATPKELHQTITGIATTLRIQHAAATAMLSGNLTGCNKILTMFNARMVANATLQKACTAGTYLWAAAKALLTGKITMATTAMKAFTATLAINPITLFITAIAGAVAGLVNTPEISPSIRV